MKTLSFFYLTILLCMSSLSALADAVDLELVLAMDASGGVSEQEYALQLNGTADALLDPSVMSAILAGPRRKIAINIMLWSDASKPKETSGWYLLDDQASIERFSNLVRNFNLKEDNIMGASGGGTGIGVGVAEALRLIRTSRYIGDRKVIDVSGDGIETKFSFSKAIMMPEAKILAQLQAVTINGLPIITSQHPKLDAYYKEHVIYGSGTFVETAKGFSDFARAIRKKLWLGIARPMAFKRQDDIQPNKNYYQLARNFEK
jgi:hypothetical protein